MYVYPDTTTSDKNTRHVDFLRFLMLNNCNPWFVIKSLEHELI